jgi:hypothetical protein
MFAAAGIVVTEIKTPIRAPDSAVVSDSNASHAREQRDDRREHVRMRDEKRLRSLVNRERLGCGFEGAQR